MSLRPISPCQPTQAVAGPVFSYLWNPYPAFPDGVHKFYGHPGLCPYGGFPDFRYLESFRPQAPHQQFGTQGGNFGPLPLGYSITGPPSYDCYRQHYSSFLHQQTGWVPFQHPVTSSSGSVPMATNSRHSHQGQTHSRLNERDSGPSILTKSVNNTRVVSPPQNSEPNLRDKGNSSSGHVCHSPQHTSSPVYVSNSGASSTSDRCSVTRLAGVVDVHVSTVSPAQQSHSETKDHPGGRSDTNSPLVAVTIVVPASTTSVCGPPSHHSVPPGPTVTTGECLSRKVIPSA